MRALVCNNHQISLHTLAALPEPREGEALLKIRQAGICNTDLELIAGMYGFSGIPGHEFVAEVEQGPPHLIGKRVVGEINIACGGCDFCQRGIPSQCRNRRTVGIRQHPGAFADYLALTVQNLHVIPDTVTDDQAVFIEPLAAALQVTELAHISPDNRIGVIGLGKLGLLIVQVLQLTGADVIGITRRESQKRLLDKWGISAAAYAEIPAESLHVVVDCTGQAQGFEDALRLIEPRGTLILKSTYHDLPRADLTQLVVREINVIGSRCGPFESAIRLLKQGLVDVTALIEARYPFDSIIEALERAAQPGALKVLLDF
ncbi:MAG: alcohol dehydrogenase catalytic domain-containing protein [Chloroflexi bacterium]|nr:alcohol dehydrogenase catalytic domain-containing protein [Chloroflexota bacterium]